ncbi:MAG TPA: zf-HC2 domain-containing protein [Candidatus Angelobacter sp.]|nr:zf-HC2 domain-containing protein [Candidatus Angelobacter sp.]
MNSQNHQNELQCGQFEAMLADALDGTLTAAGRQAFDAHAQSCSVCAPMLAEAHQGLRWLNTLEELEPPKNLLHNILAATSMAEVHSPAEAAARRRNTGFQHLLAGLMHSRFAAACSMAFFSLTLTLTVAGVHISDLASAVTHPGSLRKAIVLQYTQVESSVVKYYENMRLVYEVESRVKALRKATAQPDEKDRDRPKDKNNPNDTSGNPQRHDDYSLEQGERILAWSIVTPEGAKP